MREARYKLIYDDAPSFEGPYWFFDLVADPFEQTNLLPLGLTPEEQAVHDRLMDLLDEF